MTISFKIILHLNSTTISYPLQYKRIVILTTTVNNPMTLVYNNENINENINGKNVEMDVGVIYCQSNIFQSKIQSNTLSITNFSGDNKIIKVLGNSTTQAQIHLQNYQSKTQSFKYNGTTALVVMNQKNQVKYWLPMVHKGNDSDEIVLYNDFLIVNDLSKKTEYNTLQFIESYCQVFRDETRPNFLQIKNLSKENLFIEIEVNQKKVQVKNLQPKNVKVIKIKQFGSGKCRVRDENHKNLYEFDFQSSENKIHRIGFAQGRCFVNRQMIKIKKEEENN